VKAQDQLRDQLLALRNFPKLEVPEYSASSAVVARVGTMLADGAARVPIRPMGVWP
jgi:hypothetical protein